ncbi:MAG: hypothetical protein BRC25_01040 [Parcubacteria group bacterium SW_6_46_9]|nr:MAG: hypothetical protein BRC25_01040 [Parcubacteria group bacterium SW_6_46_9]
MLVKNLDTYIRALFSVLFVVTVFTMPWWLTALWALLGITLFTYYFESVWAAALLDAVFHPWGFPLLLTISFVIIVFATVVDNKCCFYARD